MKERIKAIRKNLGLTQEQFADALGISKSAVVSYETDRRLPNASVVSLICEKFQVRREWLETGSGEMLNPPEDETAAIVAEILADAENPLYEIILSTVKTYMELDRKDQEIIKSFARGLIKKAEKKGPE